MPGSQGTSTVRGTWSSEGEAGRHLRSKVEEDGTSSPEPILLRLGRIAAQARKYPERTEGVLRRDGVPGMWMAKSDAGSGEAAAALSYGNVRYRGTG